jgi:hypothetical protein
MQLHRMAFKLPLARFARKDFGRLLLRKLIKFCWANGSIGVFVGLVGSSCAYEDESLGIALLAGLTVEAFSSPARRTTFPGLGATA